MFNKKDLFYVICILLLILIFFNKVILNDEQLLDGNLLANTGPWAYEGQNISKINVEIPKEKQVNNNLLGDPLNDFYPKISLINKLLKSGKVPLWNPFILGGTPLLATFQSAIFYPLNLIFTFFNIGSAMTYSILLHLFLGGLFMFLFLRSLKLNRFSSFFGSLVFIFNNYIIGYLQWSVFIHTIIWLPLALFLVNKIIEKKEWKYSLFLGLVFGIQILAGELELFFYSLFFIVCYLIFRIISTKEKDYIKLSFIFLVAVLFSICLGAIHLLPAAEFANLSGREYSYSYVSATASSLPDLIKVIMPNFFGSETQNNYFGSKTYLESGFFYVGIITLILSIVALLIVKNKIKWFFFGFGALILLLVFKTHLYALFYYLIPGFSKFARIPRLSFLFIFNIAILASFGLNSLLNKIDKKSFKRLFKFNKILLIIASILFIFIILLIISKPLIETGSNSFLNSKFMQEKGINLYNSLTGRDLNKILSYGFSPIISKISSVINLEILNISLLFLFIFGSLIVLTLYYKKKIDIKLLKVLIVLILIVDLFYFSYNFNTTSKVENYLNETSSIQFLKNDSELYRIVRFGDKGRGYNQNIAFLPSNIAMIYKIQDAQGYDGLTLQKYRDFFSLIEPSIISVHNNRINNLMDEKSLNSNLLNILNVKYVLTYEKINNPKYELVYDTDILIYKNKEYLPRSFILNEYKVVKNNINEEIKKTDLKNVAIFEEEPKIEELNVKEYKVNIEDYNSNNLLIETRSDGNGILFLGDVYYPGWKAYVDGKETKIYKTNYIFRSIYLPKGVHNIEFKYEPLSFKIGAILSVLSLLILISFLNRRKKLEE